MQILRYLAIIFLGIVSQGGEFNAAPFQPQGVRSTSAEDLFQEGLQAYRSHQLPQALALLKQAYRLAPDNPKVRLALGLMLYEEDSASLDAQRLMESVALKFPDNLELQLKLLDSYLQLKNLSMLASLLERLQPTMANNTRFAFNVVYTLVRYGQLEPATAQLGKISAQLQPRMEGVAEPDVKSPAHQALVHEAGEVHFIRGMIAAGQENKSEAMRLFQAADRCDLQFLKPRFAFAE